MKRYSQLTLEQRYGIYSLLKTGHDQSEIAAVLNIDTIGVTQALTVPMLN